MKIVAALTMMIHVITSTGIEQDWLIHSRAGSTVSTYQTALQGKWVGARMIPLPNNGMHVDSVWMDFKKDGTVGFKHQKYEFNGPTSGTYTFQNNTLRVTIAKFPFHHTFEGNYNSTTGIISGLFKEIREKDPTQPPYYIPGTDTGNFTLIKNL